MIKQIIMMVVFMARWWVPARTILSTLRWNQCCNRFFSVRLLIGNFVTKTPLTDYLLEEQACLDSNV